ncbi:MAG: O-antigen ligase family protein [Fimbriimonadaceae bacterium]
MSEKVARTPVPFFVVAAVLAATIFGTWISLEPTAITSVFESVYSDSQGAAMGHALTGLVIFSGLFWICLKRRVIPIPHLKLLLPLAIVELAVAVSFGVSGYRHISLMMLFEWLGYGAAFILTVATVGRTTGVRLVLIALTLGGALLALSGYREYVAQDDPTWRIFAHTMGPNVLAAFLSVCLFPACILTATEERVGQLLSGLAGSLMIVGLILTGSKGGLLATAIGAIVMLVVSGKRQAVIGLAVCATIGFALSYGITHRPTKQQVSGSPLGRVVGASATSEQSSGFRKNLWKGAAKLMTMNPVGYGVGTYRFQSARTGTTTQTQLAHNSYLQLGVETGVLGLTGFLVFLGLVARTVLSANKGQPDGARLQKSAVLGSIAAFLVHSVFDSDLQIFGLGVLFFVLCGLAIQLSVDGSTPEFLQPTFRKGLLVCSFFAPLAMLYFGWVDIKHGQLLGGLTSQSREQLVSDMQSLQTAAPLDSRVLFTSYQVSAAAKLTPAELPGLLKRAIDLGPTLSMYRALARLTAASNSGNPNQYLDKAYELDPNNYLALALDIELNRKDDPDRAKQAAKKLVDSEQTPYFQIRSIPELVPLETYQGRAYLAESLNGKAKAEMLQPALEGLAMFADKTVKEVKRFAAAGLDGGFGGLNRAEAIADLEEGLSIVQAYREVGDAALADSVRGKLEAAAASLK